MEPLAEDLLDENIDEDNGTDEPETSVGEETENLLGEEEEEDECRVCRCPAEEG